MSMSRTDALDQIRAAVEAWTEFAPNDERETLERAFITIRNATHKAQRKPRRIRVHVRGGVAYCNARRVDIIDHDNR